MEFIEIPARVDLQIQREGGRVSRRGKRLRVKLNPVESRDFWGDLIDSGAVEGDPASDAEFAAFVALGDYDYVGTRVVLNVEDV